jgi:hypothetical protein
MPILIKPIKRNRRSNRANDRSPLRQANEPIRVPPNPTYASDQDPALYDEQQVTRCEYLMAQGVSDPSRLAELLELQDRAKIRGYVERVQSRWKVGGGEKNIAQCRGEHLALLRALEIELWQKINELKSPAVFNASGKRIQKTTRFWEFLRLMKLLMALIARRAEVQGLTKEAIKDLLDDPPLNFNHPPEVFERAVRVTAHIAEIAKQRIADEEAMRAPSPPSKGEAPQRPQIRRRQDGDGERALVSSTCASCPARQSVSASLFHAVVATSTRSGSTS